MSTTPQLRNNSVHNLKRLQKQSVKKDIRGILLQFKLSELLSDIIVELFELGLDEVKEKIISLKLPANKESVADLLDHRAKAFSLKELEDIFYSLKLYKFAFCRKNKIWQTIALLEPMDDFQCYGDVQAIHHNILQALRIKGLNAVVKVFEYEEMIWTMIIEKKLTRGKGVKLLSPVVFCFELGVPFIFVHLKVNERIMDCILKALQYRQHKVQNLQGRDVKSLLSLLKHKAEHRGNTMVVAVPSPGGPQKFYRHTDYTMRKAREKYADEVLKATSDIVLDTFTINADSVMPENVVPSINELPFRATIQLKSKNVFELIKHMVINDMVITPIPEYFAAILNSGKNNISMRIKQKRLQ